MKIVKIASEKIVRQHPLLGTWADLQVARVDNFFINSPNTRTRLSSKLSEKRRLAIRRESCDVIELIYVEPLGGWGRSGGLHSGPAKETR